MRDRARIHRLKDAIAQTVFRPADLPVPVTVCSDSGKPAGAAPPTGKLARVSIQITRARAEPSSPGLLIALWRRSGRLVHELGKFVVVVGITFVIDVTVFNLLRDAVGP